MERRIIKEVCSGNEVSTIYFEEPLFKSDLDILYVDIRNFMFRGMKRPQKGDVMDIAVIDGKLVFFLNQVKVGSKRTPLSLPPEVLQASEVRRQRALERVNKAKKRLGLL